MCGATTGGLSVEGIDVTTEAIIQGSVLSAAGPIGRAYVRLLDSAGEFTAEVPTSPTGHFRFFAAPGSWTVRVLSPGNESVDRPVVAERGLVAEVEVHV